MQLESDVVTKAERTGLAASVALDHVHRRRLDARVGEFVERHDGVHLDEGVLHTIGRRLVHLDGREHRLVEFQVDSYISRWRAENVPFAGKTRVTSDW